MSGTGDGNISKHSPGTTNLSDDSGDADVVQQQVDEAVPIAESPKRNIREELGFNQDDDNEDGARTAFAVPSTAEEIEEAKVRWGDNTCQMKALRFINSDLVQRLLVGLLVMDVFILLGELAIDAFVPACSFVVRDGISCCPSDSHDDTHRFLGGGGGYEEICNYPLVETDNKAGCDSHKYEGVHIAHTVLFWMTVAILSTFAVELISLIYLIGPKMFCCQPTYVVDFVVVISSLTLELIFKFSSEDALAALPGILIVFRLWRFVRIGHGLVASTYEVQQHKIETAVDYISELEEKLERCEVALPQRPKSLKSSTSMKLKRKLSAEGTDASHTGSSVGGTMRNSMRRLTLTQDTASSQEPQRETELSDRSGLHQSQQR